MPGKFLIYGANGYTGELIIRYAVERGMRPMVAGRNETAINTIAEKYDLDRRVFALGDREKLDAALNEVEMVLHCAGPFSLTSKPMVEACLRNRKHYTDITGEISVFESCAAQDARAKEAGIMIIPGVGFDVVPTDCLAVHLKNRLPSATHLTLAFYGKGRLSHGTQATMVLNIGRGGAIRRDGKITPVPAAWRTREIDFGGVTRTAVTIPWGDVSTAYHSTGIPNIEVYTVVPPSQLKMLRMSRRAAWLLAFGPINRLIRQRIPPGGPSDEERATGETLIWGEARDNDGNRVGSRMRTPEGYTVTALAALNITEKILAGNFQRGFQTPARCYGADLVLEIEGVSREEVI